MRSIVMVTLGIACGAFGCATDDQAQAGGQAPPPVAVRTGRGPDSNAYSLEEDGYYELYSGPGIAEVVESGEIADDTEHGYMMLRVPSEVVERAASEVDRVVSLTMEDPAVDAAVTIHRPEVAHDDDHASSNSGVFRAGDPDVYGFVQVLISEDGAPVGLIDLTVVRRFPSGVVAPNYYTTGTVPASDIPEQSDENPRLSGPPGE